MIHNNDSITAILVSRFMFDLQKVKQLTQHRTESLGGTTISAPEFNRVLGSIGSILGTTDVWRVGSDLEQGASEGEAATTEVAVDDVFRKGGVVIALAPAASRDSDLD